MSIASDIRSDSKAARKIRLPWWGVLCWMAACALITWLLDHLGKFNLALPALDSIGMLGFAIAIKWKLRRQRWFWVTMLAMAVLHVPVILFVPWTTSWVPAPVIVPFAIADLLVMLAILAIVGKFMEGQKTTEGS